LGPEVVGIICHESCGHPQEADRILGREAAQAGESYLEPDMIGTKIGSEYVTIVDDPTLPKSFGYYLYDDEGVEARERMLVDKGKVANFLQNRETAAELGVKSNGAARAVAYSREPMIRMANTYMKPGSYDREELFDDIKSGVYIKTFMEWNIDDRRFNQRYVGLEAYLIRNGEIDKPVRNPVLEVTTPSLYGSVDAVSNTVDFQAATCGKGDPQQGASVWTGGPEIRLRGLRLGGLEA
jgi:TldD protein